MMQMQINNATGTTQNSDVNGKAKIESVTDGVYRVIWQHDTCEGALGPIIRVREGQTVDVPAVQLKPKEGGSLHVTLQDENKKPLDKINFYLSLEPAGKTKTEKASEAASKAFKANIQQLMMNNSSSPAHPTDEKGQATIEALKPGIYRVKIMSTSLDPQNRFIFAGQDTNDEKRNDFIAEDIEIKGKATTDLTLTPFTGTTVKGKVLTEKGDAVHDAMLTLVTERALAAGGPQILQQNYVDISFNEMKFKQTRQDGGYDFKQVNPGRYVLGIRARTGETAIVYGIEVTQDKSVTVPDVKLKAPKKTFNSIKGKVVLDDGSPAKGATVYLETVTANSRSSSGSGTNDKGEFDFNSAWFNGGAQPNHVRIILAGYHSVFVDLADPDLKVDQLSLTLKKREYGKLCVKVVDEAGKPVPGARVFPNGAAGWPTYNRNGVSRPIQKTDDRGELRLSGLADGPRKIRVEALGYFTDPELKTDVRKDEETTIKVVLRKGLELLTGHLELPPLPPLPSTVTAAAAKLSAPRTAAARMSGSP